jgi:hypothetical protein
MSDIPALPPPPPPAAPPDGIGGNGGSAGGGLPWELRDRYGAFAGFVETVRRLISSPTAAFAEARRQGDLVSPIAYAVLVGWVGIVGQRLWGLVIGTSVLDLLPSQAREGAALGFALSGVGLAVALIVAPIVLLVGLLVGGGILHLFLLLFGATRESTSGFEGTLRVVAWSTTAHLAQFVPLVGGLLGVVWSVILLTLGIVSFHRTTSGRALAAVLTPIALCCVCIVVAGLGVIAMIVGAVAAGSH